MPQRRSFDLQTYIRDIQTRPCFICEMVAGNPAYTHEIVYEDDIAIAFLNRYPPL
jgi:histidine triad (HIT) family protein